MKRKEIPDFIAAIRKLREGASDELALEATFAYSEWKPGTAYTVGERIRYGGSLFRCEQAHTSQEGWEPDAAVTRVLWTPASVEEWPEWVQPTGAQDAYAAGDKVTYGGKRWVSDISGNVWEPGVYGWTEAGRRLQHNGLGLFCDGGGAAAVGLKTQYIYGGIKHGK